MDVEWLILADYAEAIGGKLYLQGGGWEQLTVLNEFPATRQVGIAASFSVPWTQTNETATFEIEVLTDDGRSLMKMEGEFRVGQPATHPPGQDQRFQVTSNATLRIDDPGVYVIIARLNGEDRRQVPFFVVPGPELAMKLRQAKG